MQSAFVNAGQLQLPLFFIATLVAPSIATGSPTDPDTYFGHEIRFSGTFGEERVLVDGKEMVRNGSVGISEVAVVKGVGVAIGFSGSGGNVCDASPFVISFPEGKAPRFDGPLDTCDEVKHVTTNDEIKFEIAAIPGRDGQRWSWTPQSGFQSLGSIKHVESPEKTWSDLRSRNIQHPSELFDYADIASQMHALLGTDEKPFLSIITGVGSVDFQGDLFVGQSCARHMCGDEEALIVADLEKQTVFLAWKTENAPIIVRPPVKDWSAAARAALRDWAKAWTSKK
jgi:hypothetical protein